MLSHRLFETLSLWPAVVWPIAYSACLIAYMRLCQISRLTFGVSPLDGDTWPGKVALYVMVPTGLIFNVVTHAYLIYVGGYIYVIVAIPIYIFGWILIPWILDGFRPAPVLLAFLHVTFVVAFLVLLGMLDIALVRALNSEIFILLTGVPTPY